jgi:hypothetical protein
MVKMLALHCHTSFGPMMHGLMDALKMPGMWYIKVQRF